MLFVATENIVGKQACNNQLHVILFRDYTVFFVVEIHHFPRYFPFINKHMYFTCVWNGSGGLYTKRLREIYESCSAKSGLNAFAKSIDSCQPAQSAQADMSRNFSLSFNFLHIKKKNLRYDSIICLTKWFQWIYIIRYYLV